MSDDGLFDDSDNASPAMDDLRLELLRAEGLQLLRCFHAIENTELRRSILDVLNTLETPSEPTPSESKAPLRFPGR